MPVINEVTPVRIGSNVPPHYVHKRDESEVLVTSCESFRPDTFAVAARWPAQHPFYLSHNGLHDPMLFAESVRQCFPLLSHAGYDLPFGHHLIWQYLTYEVVPSAMRTGPGRAELDLYITCSDIRYRSGRLAALTLHVVALRGGEHLGTAEARFSCHSPSIYRRLRGPYADLPRAVAAAGAPPPPVSPSCVARDRKENVVLSPTGHHGRWTLRNDTSHPVLFDHPLDHSPGMLVLEAARQATHAVCGADAYPFRVESTFLQFTELDAPCRVSASPEATSSQDRRRVQVITSQGGDTTFTSVVTALVGSPAAR